MCGICLSVTQHVCRARRECKQNLVNEDKDDRSYSALCASSEFSSGCPYTTPPVDSITYAPCKSVNARACPLQSASYERQLCPYAGGMLGFVEERVSRCQSRASSVDTDLFHVRSVDSSDSSSAESDRKCRKCSTVTDATMVTCSNMAALNWTKFEPSVPCTGDSCSSSCICGVRSESDEEMLSRKQKKKYYNRGYNSSCFVRLANNVARRGPDMSSGVSRFDHSHSVRTHCSNSTLLSRGCCGSGVHVGQVNGALHRCDQCCSQKGVAGSCITENNYFSDDGMCYSECVESMVRGLASVLGLRGREPVGQPYEISLSSAASSLLMDTEVINRDVSPARVCDEHVDGDASTGNPKKSFLMWNGEIFGGKLCPPPWGSDTKILANHLANIEFECATTSHLVSFDLSSLSSDSPNCKRVLRARQELFLSRCVELFEDEIEGPYGFVYYAARLRVAVYGRDPLGRHSLVTHAAAYRTFDTGYNCHGAMVEDELYIEFIVSSVGVRHHCANNVVRGDGVASPELVGVHTSIGSSVSAVTADAKSDVDCTCTVHHSTEELYSQRVSPIKRPRLSDDGGANVLTSHHHLREAVSDSNISCGCADCNDDDNINKLNICNKAEKDTSVRVRNGFKKSIADKECSNCHTCVLKSGEGKPCLLDKKSSFHCRSMKDEDDDDVEEGEVHGDVCWEEVPVTGLFAIPINQALLTRFDTHDCSIDHASYQSELPPKIALMHCCWGKEKHRIHPLLRRVDVNSVCRNQTNTETTSTPHHNTPSGQSGVDNTQTASAYAMNACHRHAAQCEHDDDVRSKQEVMLVYEEAEHSKHADARSDWCTTMDRKKSVHPCSKSSRTPREVSMGIICALSPSPPSIGTLMPPAALPQVVLQHIASCGLEQLASHEAMWTHWAAVRYLYALAEAVARRVDVTRSGADNELDSVKLFHARSRPVCILFSGGIDSTVLAALTHYLLPAETPIELVNVAFGEHPEHAPDRIAALRAMHELLLLPQPYDYIQSDSSIPTTGTGHNEGSVPTSASNASSKPFFTDCCRSRAARNPAVITRRWEREWRLVFVDVPQKYSTHTSHVLDLVTPRDTVMDLDIGTALWFAAQGQGRMQVLRRSDVVGVSCEDHPKFQNVSSPSLKHSLTRGAEMKVEPACTNSAIVSDAQDSVDIGMGELAGFCKHFRVHAQEESAAAHRNNNNNKTTTNSSHGVPPREISGSSSATVAASAQASSLLSSTVSAKRLSLHSCAGGYTDALSANSSLTGEEIRERFGILIEVLVLEGRQGGGPDAPVLLSTLGKEYGSFLQPHIAAWNYKKLGSYLNDATHAGVIAFAPQAPSKAVYLVRPQDRARAMAVQPSRWLPTRYMKDISSVDSSSLTSVSNSEMHQNGMAKKTERDTSIHRGESDNATMRNPSLLEFYESEAKVLLLGMGADETLGGYTRYRRFFRRFGMSGAREELQKDFARLWQRNLGRDDRITMDSGREPRFPFLDEQLLRTLEDIVAVRHDCIERMRANAKGDDDSTEASTSSADQDHMNKHHRDAENLRHIRDIDENTCLQWCMEPVVSFEMNPGEGDKRILRNVATLLGLRTVARLQKRAIQFGSRIADRKVRGTTTLKTALGNMV